MKVLFFMMLALLLVPVVCFGGPDLSEVFSDCTYWHRNYSSASTADTLWFTATQSGAGTGLDFDGGAGQEDEALYSQYGPILVPVGARGDGSLIKEIMPVKKLLVYSRVPFTTQVFSNGLTEKFASAVDSLAASGGASEVMDTFPCWAVYSYPDSIYQSDAGADSVIYYMGY